MNIRNSFMNIQNQLRVFKNVFFVNFYLPYSNILVNL